MPAPKQRHDGEGSVFETVNNGVSVFFAQETYRDDQGRRRYITGTGKTPAEAMKRRAANRVRRMNRKQQEDNPSPTVAEYLDRYLLNRQSDLAPESVRKYRRDFELHVIPHLGKKRLGELGTEQLDRFFYETHATLGHSAKWHVYTNLNALLNHAIKHGAIDRNPLMLVNKPEKKTEVAREDAKFINARVSAATGFLKWLHDPENGHAEHYPRILFMFLGLRRAEILGLEWSCINQLNRKGKATLIIRQQLKRYEKHEEEDGWYIKALTKSGKDRVIYLPEAYRLALVEVQKKKRTAKDAQFSDLVFLTPEGSPTTWSRHDTAWRELYREYLSRGKTPQPNLYFRPHYARHITASVMLKEGIGIEAIQSILGHSEAAMALHYAHLTREAKQGAAEAAGTIAPTAIK